MGLFTHLFGPRQSETLATTGVQKKKRRGTVRGQVETLEPRQLLAADVPEVLLGSVYFEEATGDDSQPDVIEVTFVGGAEGTTLDRLVISGDKRADGLTDGDLFFDIADGGKGAFESVGLSIIDTTGFSIDSVSVVDGGTDIVIAFSGFDAGEKLQFSVDADELQFADPAGDSVNSLVEGAEFERSILTGEFSAPGFVDLTLEARYWDAFDPNIDTAESNTGLQLSLPDDRYSDQRDFTDRTAGAVVHAPQIPLASISGWVYHDRSDDGQFDTPTEEGIGGVTLELLDAEGQGTGIFTTTSSEPGSVGYYEFLNLTAGTYGVREVQPDGWLDGKDTPGSHGGTAADETAGRVDMITGAVLAFGDNGINYNFGELLPGSIAGRVSVSYDGDCHFDDPQEVLEGVQIDLLDAQGNVLETTFTDSEGRYKFDNLAPGEYQVREHQPTEYFDGGERIGTAGGTKSDLGDTYSLFSNILLGSDVDATQYDFCEHVGPSLSGWVYHDRSNDGVFDRDTEEGISGVVMELLDENGVPTGITTVTSTSTGKVGYYEFTNLAPGKYGVREFQPEGWLDGIDTPGTHGGVAADESLGRVDIITGAMLAFGDNAQEYNFGELLPGSIAGRVSASTDGDCHFDEPEILLEDVRIDLLDESGTVIETTFTDTDGRYQFVDLAPGVYQVFEHQPEEYLNGGRRVGSAGGEKTGTDTISQIIIDSGLHAIEYDFCEHVGATLSGNVYHDRSNDGIFDRDTEEGIPEVTLKLLDGDGNDTGRRTVTDAEGYYEFTDLETGKYSIMEIHPEDWLDGIDTPGNLGGVAQTSPPGDMISQIMITAGQTGIEYNFGELLPGSIRGNVYVDMDGDCVHDDEEPPIVGVQVDLLDESGAVLETTYTDADGAYAFEDLYPGIYTVYEHQPTEYFNGGQQIGSGGGTDLAVDTIGEIVVGSDQHFINYDFCEIPPAELSGYVFIDGAPIFVINELPSDLLSIRDGQRTPDDTPLAGVVVELRQGFSGDPIFGDEALPGYYSDGPIRTVTDANGYYEFRGLPAGTYAVVEIHPEGLIDYLETEGSNGGLVVNAMVDPLDTTPTPGQLVAIEQMRDRFGNDIIFRIPLAAGQQSVENNFSELQTTTLWIPEDPPPVDPPLVFDPPPVAPVSQPLRPVAPPEPPAPPTYTGGSRVYQYTWHLSLVNAGFPRSTASQGARMQLTSTHFTSHSWQQVQIQNATWTLEKGEESEEEPGSTQIVFGHPRGIPVVGDWDGDGDDEVGIFIDGKWYLDLNGNGRWDSGDILAELGTAGDLPTTGDWDGDGKTDIAIFGPAWTRDAWAIEHEPGLPDAENYPGPLAFKEKNVPPKVEEATTGERLLKRSRQGEVRSDLIDHVFFYGVAGDQPVTGDWNGDGITTIGVYRGGVWNLDLNGDGQFTDVDATVAFGGPGIPVVGDWNGDGIDDLAVFNSGRWTVDSNGDRELDAKDRVFELGTAGDRPVAGDWDGDGVDQPGVYTPGEQAEVADEAA